MVVCVTHMLYYQIISINSIIPELPTYRNIAETVQRGVVITTDY